MPTSPETLVTDMMPQKQSVVEAGVTAFADNLRADMVGQPPDAQAATESYLALLQRGGKRLRGVFADTGYRLAGGEDTALISTAAGIIEALHAYLLVMDDVADNALTRRGGPSAHIFMRDYLSDNGAINAAKLGIDTVQTAALIAQHKAQSSLMRLPTSLERKVLAASILNDGLVLTGIGQLRDLSIHSPNAAGALETARLKTAWYTYLLPLQAGAAWAGSPEADLRRLEKYSLHTGLAFQLRDDILGLFGKEADTGKPEISDIVEDKHTLLMLYALEAASEADRTFLRSALGNVALNHADFITCRTIVRKSGALRKTQEMVVHHTLQAVESLTDLPESWNQQEVAFLRAIALQGLQRRA